MSQMTFSDYEYSLRKRRTKREEFLDIMNEIIPWEEWVEFYDRITQTTSVADQQKESKKCCGYICCRSGSISLTRVWKMPSMTAMHSGNS